MPEKTLKSRLEEYYTLYLELPLTIDRIINERNRVKCVGLYLDQDYLGNQKERVLTVSNGCMRTIADLEDRVVEIEKEIEELSDMVHKVGDSEMRQILTIAYLSGGKENRWERVADHFQREATGSAYRKRATRFLEKVDLAARMARMAQMS